VPASLKLRTWLPDELYSILLQTPTQIPSTLPEVSEDGRLPLVPTEEISAEQFLEEERNHRPRQLMYRFYACGGFWLCENLNIVHFLRSFKDKQLLDCVPFVREVMKVRDKYFVPAIYMYTENPRHPKVPSSTTLSAIEERRDLHLVYNELFRALAYQGRDTEFLSLWKEAESCM
jgi:hypothetical protein